LLGDLIAKQRKRFYKMSCAIAGFATIASRAHLLSMGGNIPVGWVA
jgi:hypothetical protein